MRPRANDHAFALVRRRTGWEKGSVSERGNHSESTAVKAARTRRSLLVALACALLAAFAAVGAWRFKDEADAALMAEANVQERVAGDAAEQANSAIAHSLGHAGRRHGTGERR